MPKPSKFGERLVSVRKLRALTQEQLAERARVPAAVISHFETGVRASASADNLVKLADALGVSIDYLLGRTDEMASVVGAFDKKASQMSDANRQVFEELAEYLARAPRREPGRRK